MSFKTFLQGLGSVVGKVSAVATTVFPILSPFLGSGAQQTNVRSYTTEGINNDLTQIASVVTTAEAMFQAPGSGATKLAASTPLVLQILRTSQAFDGKKIANEALAEQGASKIVSGLADFMNAIHPDQVNVTPVTQ